MFDDQSAKEEEKSEKEQLNQLLQRKLDHLSKEERELI